MQDLKISIITVVFNAENTISRCIESVIAQDFKNIEYIIIDGGSTDNTLQIINRYRDKIDIFLSEPDKGIYDAMNKGIKSATGEVIGTLNADDFFSGIGVLSIIANTFKQNDIAITYGDLDYVAANGKPVRKWRAGEYAHGQFNWGWMPPHPTFYCKKILYEQLGLYRCDFGTAGDYELMLRFIHINHIKAVYIKIVMVKMEIGGKSNKSIINRVKGLFFDFKAMRNNGIFLPALTVIIKPLRKISQYF